MQLFIGSKPAVKQYIKEEYSAADLGLEGDFVLRPHDGASGKYNAKYFGAPTNLSLIHI